MVYEEMVVVEKKVKQVGKFHRSRLGKHQVFALLTHKYEYVLDTEGVRNNTVVV